jgi:hypothetical protein
VFLISKKSPFVKGFFYVTLAINPNEKQNIKQVMDFGKIFP